MSEGPRPPLRLSCPLDFNGGDERMICGKGTRDYTLQDAPHAGGCRSCPAAAPQAPEFAHLIVRTESLKFSHSLYVGVLGGQVWLGWSGSDGLGTWPGSDAFPRNFVQTCVNLHNPVRN